MGVEQGAGSLVGWSFDQPDALSGRSRVDQLKSSGKPLVISKWEVWEAWRRAGEQGRTRGG
jgi:hypothetical protein